MVTYGFFQLNEFKDTKQSPKKGSTLSCYACGLYKNARTQRMAPWGQNKKKLVVIGEAPGETEDLKGKPWQGKAGKRLQSELRRLDIDLETDALSTNSANCRPPGNRTPSDHEVACCRARIVDPTLQTASARVILLLGGSAIDSVIGPRMKGGSAVSLWRGWTIPDQELNAWVCPTFHPSYVERESERPEVTTIWRQDLSQAIDMLDRPVPSFTDYKKHLRLLHNEDDIETVLKRIVDREEGELTAFDYETTGLKPHAPGHKIVCTSVATERGCYAFMGPRSDRIRSLWKRYLRSPNIKKIAQNLKFEDTWSEVMFGVSVRNWHWDPMLAAHILDNRPKVTGLKFQTYVNFGVAGYDDAISPYLKGVETKNANSINRIDDAIRDLGEDEVLTYCGSDSIFTLWLALKQRRELGVT